jgi:PPP family 3-phenylpropionic acid transporter
VALRVHAAWNHARKHDAGRDNGDKVNRIFGLGSRPGSERAAPIGSFIVVYALLYAAFGAASPFLPALVEARGTAPHLIGAVFAAGTATRLISAPIAARIADRTQALRLTLALCAVAAAFAVLGYLIVGGFWPLLVVSVMHAFALGPTTGLADALALVAARREKPLGFEYGWVRGSGSAAFIAGSIVAGWAVALQGLGVVVWLQALLLLALPFAVSRVPTIGAKAGAVTVTRQSAAVLFRLPVFRRVLLVAALILGSHAMHDTFSVIRWNAAGISPQTISILWSVSVAAEVVVFFVVGPWLVRKFRPAGAVALAALAGATRWLVTAYTVDIVALSLMQPLHGITFALLHLACMRLLALSVPDALSATAQAIYGTVGVGAATAIITLMSGWLYGRLGAAAFVAMAVLCLAALPVARSLAAANGGSPSR